MDEPAIRQLLDDVKSGALAPDDAVMKLRRLPFADLGFARVDHHRSLRQGMPEAVYGPGKTPEQCAEIVAELLSEPDGGPVLLTRATEAQIEAVEQHNGGANRRGWTLWWRESDKRPARVLVITAGTSDLPVAEEAMATLQAYGISAALNVDCGVAGVHRLLSTMDEVEDADALIVIAGMEGALASVVGGLTSAPVVAVPTSVGYGAGLEGVTALLAMHASCAAGISVVGIDNGYGAACAVIRLLPS